MIFRQLFDQVSSTYTYVLADELSREAVLVDPVFEQHARDAALVRELGLTLMATIDTHCHADHVTGAWLMKVALGSKIALSRDYGATNVNRPLSDGDVVPFDPKRSRSAQRPVTPPGACRSSRGTDGWFSPATLSWCAARDAPTSSRATRVVSFARFATAS